METPSRSPRVTLISSCVRIPARPDDRGVHADRVGDDFFPLGPGSVERLTEGGRAGVFMQFCQLPQGRSALV